MKLTTPIDMPAGLPRLSQAHHMLLMGSCFATEMGERLLQAKFPCEVNPFGVLYNPLSIAVALHEIGSGKHYVKEMLFRHQNLWHSPMHHGDFSSASPEETLQCINRRIDYAHKAMQHLDALLLTWGTAWVYEDAETRCVVGNCHKLPDKNFLRRRLSVEEIVAEYTGLLHRLFAHRPQLRVLLTVSPIRHLRDGLHDNQLSKSTLLLAADALRQRFPQQVSYFPAYEILLDELRDYRFYADDMVHPSSLAVEYVWQRFSQSCFTDDALQIAGQCEEIHKMLAHKPFHPEADAYKRFLEQIVLKIERLNEKYPYLVLQNERELCHTLLNK